MPDECLMVRRAWIAVIACALLSPAAAGGQDSSRAPVPEASACWRFSFGAWDPPLDWAGSGHDGTAGTMADRIRRVRDSIFVRDSSAVNSNPMYWERTEKGLMLFLFPPWWPVGVEVQFDPVAPGSADMSGTALALLADASRQPSKARVRARRVECGGGR